MSIELAIDLGGEKNLDIELERVAAGIIERLTTTSQIRDRALGDCRQVVRWSANSVRAVHRGDVAEAQRELQHARDLVQSLISYTKALPSVYWAGYVQDALKEFAEAAITSAIIRGGAIPTPAELAVEDASYLNALAEAASELRRDTLDLLRGDDLDRARELLGVMDDIYSLLVSIDFPDAITGGLRRTTDSLRAVLERTRGDLTVTINQRRLERAVQSMQRQLALDNVAVNPTESPEAQS